MYVIVYRPETDPLQVVAILHGKQDLEQILKIGWNNHDLRPSDAAG